MVHQLPLVVRDLSCFLTQENLLKCERTELHAPITSSSDEVIRQDNDRNNEEEMNEWGCYMEGKPPQ